MGARWVTASCGSAWAKDTAGEADLRPVRRWALRDDSVRLDLDQQCRVDETWHFHHRARRANRPENLTVSAADFLPPANVGHENRRADDMLQSGTKLVQRIGDPTQRFASLLADVVTTNRPFALDSRSRTGDRNPAAHSDSTGVTDKWLPLGSRRHQSMLAHAPIMHRRNEDHADRKSVDAGADDDHQQRRGRRCTQRRGDSRPRHGGGPAPFHHQLVVRSSEDSTRPVMLATSSKAVPWRSAVWSAVASTTTKDSMSRQNASYVVARTSGRREDSYDHKLVATRRRSSTARSVAKKAL